MKTLDKITTKLRAGHYVITANETFHIVKNPDGWGIYTQSKAENGDRFYYDHNANKIWVTFGCGSWVDDAFNNRYSTLESALETLETVIFNKSCLR
mgnify:CR=1 FL=1